MVAENPFSTFVFFFFIIHFCPFCFYVFSSNFFLVQIMKQIQAKMFVACTPSHPLRTAP